MGRMETETETSALSIARPTLTTSESKRHVLDEDLHSSQHKETKRYSFKIDDPSVSVSEEHGDDDDDDDDAAGTSMAAASFCDASINSEADEGYLRRGMSFTADGNMVDMVEFYRQENTSGVERSEDRLTPEMIADRAIRQAQEAGFDDLSEDELELDIRRQMEEEEQIRKHKAQPKQAT
jgi:hypothetical protein